MGNGGVESYFLVFSDKDVSQALLLLKKSLGRLKNQNNVRKESLALSPRVIYVVALTFFKYLVYLDIAFHLL